MADDLRTRALALCDYLDRCGITNTARSIRSVVDDLLADIDRLTAERDEALARIDREWCLGLERENVRLTAELDRLTAERDELRYSLKLAYAAECVAVDRLFAERDRLRNLAAALEAEVARAGERVAELEAQAQFWATT